MKSTTAMDKAWELVEQMARMTTPYDPAKVAEFKREWPNHANLEGEELRTEIYCEYPSDDAVEEVQTFWRLIEAAREITGIELEQAA